MFKEIWFMINISHLLIPHFLHGCTVLQVLFRPDCIRCGNSTSSKILGFLVYFISSLL